MKGSISLFSFETGHTKATEVMQKGLLIKKQDGEIITMSVLIG